jgi:hypothetical protein
MRRLKLSLREYLGALVPSAITTLATTLGPLAVIGLNGFNIDISVLQAILGGGLGGVFWFLAMGLTRHPFTAEMAHLLGRAQSFAPPSLHPFLALIQRFLGEDTGQTATPGDAGNET